MKVREILKDCTQWIPGNGYELGTPKVSVLLPTFRRAKNGLFEKAVQSVLRQDYRNLELIIIDDCSTDGSADLIRHFMQSDSRISCLRHTFNVGLPAISEYEGYCKAKGDYIAFIFDDNQWDRDYLDKALGYMVRNDAKATFNIVHSYYGQSDHEYLRLGSTRDVLSISALAYTNFIANGGVVLHREVLETVGLYDPHLLLTKLCDWDLWKRIVKKYEFHETGIFSGTELGATQEDSIGNSLTVGRWGVLEEINRDRTVQLLPANFGEAEIDCVPSNATPLFRDTVQRRWEDYQSKRWYTTRVKEAATVPSQAVRRVLVCSTEFNATTSLFIERLAQNNPDILYGFSVPGGLPTAELLYADAAIIIRNLNAFKTERKICESFSIPCFFYIDDNFIELAKDNRKDYTIKGLAETLQYQQLIKFDAVLVSTPKLLEFCQVHHLHRRILLAEPVMDLRNMLDYHPVSADKEELTVAFMGGPWRMDLFAQTVLPVLAQISLCRPVTVICPGENRSTWQKEFQKFSGLVIQEIPRSLSLEETLLRFGKARPQLLVHCGTDQRNNVYKTENALINAVQLGAVLVSSNVAPYCETGEDCCLLADNTYEGWEAAIDSLLAMPERHRELYENARRYCERRYTAAQAKTAIEGDLLKISPAEHIDLLKRYDCLYFDIAYCGGAKFTGDATLHGRTSRSLTEAPLSFTGGLCGVRKYGVICPKENISELGLCFSSYGDPTGWVRIGISCQDGQLRELVLDMEDYVRDNWTYLPIDPPIQGKCGQKLTIALDFEYQEGSHLMGVFEDARNRTFLFKVFNKLHHPILGKNVLFVDYQE